MTFWTARPSVISSWYTARVPSSLGSWLQSAVKQIRSDDNNTDFNAFSSLSKSADLSLHVTWRNCAARDWCWHVAVRIGELLQQWVVCIFFFFLFFFSFVRWQPRWPSGKASASRAEDPGFESRLCRDFFRVKSYQWLKNWHSSGYLARRLAL